MKHIKRSFLTALLLALFSGMSFAQPALVDGVIAVVGKNIVLQSEVGRQYEQRKAQAQGAMDITMCNVFEDMLIEKLLLNQAALDSVTVDDSEVQMNINRRLDYFIQQLGSRQKLEQYYNKSVEQIEEEMFDLVRDQMLAQRMMQEINKDVKITPTEVRNFYKDIPKDSLPLINTELEYSEIVKYPEVSDEARQTAIDRLNEIKERIAEGSSFSTMAVLYSEDPGSAKSGGEYKGIKRGQFVKEFEAVAFNLEVGEISTPFKTEYGYHIVQLQKKRGQELDLRHILIKPKISAEALADAKAFLDSIRTLVLNEEYSFGEAAEKFSEAEDSKLNEGKVVNPQSGDARWETGQLDKQVFYALENMKKGEISEPVFFRTQDDKEGYRLVKLNNRIEAHVANLQTDYQRIQNVALTQKKQKVMTDWIDDKLRTTYVRVNNDYLQCEFRRDWIKQSQYAE